MNLPLLSKGDRVVIKSGIYSGHYGTVAEQQLTPDELIAVEIDSNAEPKVQAFLSGALVRAETPKRASVTPSADFGHNSRASVPPTDHVNHPSHYNSGGYECLDIMEAVFGKEAAINFCHLNAFKYLWRCGHKDDAKQELAKARFYIDHEIKLINK